MLNTFLFLWAAVLWWGKQALNTELGLCRHFARYECLGRVRKQEQITWG